MPGIGKSTLARRYADDHPSTLDCDIDVLRSLVGGWRDDFGLAGALVRPAALAMITAYLREGQDVVLPQMILLPEELGRFEGAALAADASFVEVLLRTDRETVAARFGRRGADGVDASWHDHVRGVVEEMGGEAMLLDCHDRLEALAADRPGAVVVDSREGAVDETYTALLRALGG